ncbi:type I methionyl aminopeptidase [Aquihabitans sp. G128]|uniref:type I methionyl aminopeptidase n=1 Tax=Aquihabitans sp. G128 TaxID=2849779 RepID=UPI001C2192D1|nr:type I methionyl aminopeptidase [Aquihabitans sp. G128]QXC62730.1 type I methionyl aminopeptidase [Aquihabitans sp. G128]
MTAPVVALSKMKPNDPCWCGSGLKFKRCHKPTTDRIVAGTLSPRRDVPASVERPPWADSGTGSDRSEADVKSADVIDRMRRTGRLAGDVLAQVGAAVAPGVTTDELDALCHQITVDAGAYPSPLNYNGYKKSLCTSVNEVICHGIPDSRALRDGDIVNLDVTCFREGVNGDTNATFFVGTVDPESQRLVQVTRECLTLAIAQVRPGQPINAIGRAIQDHAEGAGFGVVRSFIGHGIGETFHTDLAIPHYYVPAAADPRAAKQLVPGMVFTIEPMITVGDWRHRLWDDDWTATTVDNKRTAQFEHTLLVTEDGVDILTLRTDGRWSGDGGQPGD